MAVPFGGSLRENFDSIRHGLASLLVSSRSASSSAELQAVGVMSAPTAYFFSRLLAVPTST
jgi:hypothetical protein